MESLRGQEVPSWFKELQEAPEYSHNYDTSQNKKCFSANPKSGIFRRLFKELCQYGIFFLDPNIVSQVYFFMTCLFTTGPKNGKQIRPKYKNKISTNTILQDTWLGTSSPYKIQLFSPMIRMGQIQIVVTQGFISFCIKKNF